MGELIYNITIENGRRVFIIVLENICMYMHEGMDECMCAWIYIDRWMHGVSVSMHAFMCMYGWMVWVHECMHVCMCMDGWCELMNAFHAFFST
jgi:hypothetical protein